VVRPAANLNGSQITKISKIGYHEVMNVSLTPQLEALVRAKVKAGTYQTVSEVVREGLRLIKERDDQHARLCADVQAGLDQVARGEYTEYKVDGKRKLAKEICARGRRRLAQMKKTPSR
jgi:antitoxin ParD1/3/4